MADQNATFREIRETPEGQLMALRHGGTEWEPITQELAERSFEGPVTQAVKTGLTAVAQGGLLAADVAETALVPPSMRGAPGAGGMVGPAMQGVAESEPVAEMLQAQEERRTLDPRATMATELASGVAAGGVPGMVRGAGARAAAPAVAREVAGEATQDVVELGGRGVLARASGVADTIAPNTSTARVMRGINDAVENRAAVKAIASDATGGPTALRGLQTADELTAMGVDVPDPMRAMLAAPDTPTLNAARRANQAAELRSRSLDAEPEGFLEGKITGNVGSEYARAEEQMRAALNRQVAEELGIPDTPGPITTNVVGERIDDIGTELDRLQNVAIERAGTGGVPAKGVAKEIEEIAPALGDEEVDRVLGRLVDKVDRNIDETGNLTPAAYNEIRRDITESMELARKRGDVPVGDALMEAREALDRSLKANLSPEEAALDADLRKQYRMAMTLTNAKGTLSPTEGINPRSFVSALGRKSTGAKRGRGYANTGSLKLARTMEALTQAATGNSGTSQTQQALRGATANLGTKAAVATGGLGGLNVLFGD